MFSVLEEHTSTLKRVACRVFSSSGYEPQFAVDHLSLAIAEIRAPLFMVFGHRDRRFSLLPWSLEFTYIRTILFKMKVLLQKIHTSKIVGFWNVTLCISEKPDVSEELITSIYRTEE
jgi:hypothetical protein